ncbi:MAG: nicotinate-nucleotide adenylyltransferase [Eubacteriales bacterium]|nr:nicotinate-nucleotide adenylyltransferase [Eubacteriales bacterium]
MKRIGIFGGTFNPIHNGHLILAEAARQNCCLEEVLLIPSGCSYMKDQREILPGKIRLEMARLAALDNPYFTVSDIEINRAGYSYTSETLKQLRRKMPDARLYYIIGADTLFHMENWKNPEQIFSDCVLVAAVRDGWENARMERQISYLTDKYHADIRLLPSLHIEISSTEIRNRCRKNLSIRYLVPESVRLFLEQNGYYS